MLVDGRWVPTFPNARYIFTTPEFEYWQATSYPDGDDIFADSFKSWVGSGVGNLKGGSVSPTLGSDCVHGTGEQVVPEIKPPPPDTTRSHSW